MRTRLVAVAFTVAGTAVAMLVGPNGPLGGFWRPEAIDPPPHGAQLAWMIGARLVEAVGFGLALAVLFAGRSAFTALTRSPGRATAAQVSTAWLLGSWWPHSALHMHIGLAVGPLVVVEWVFHVGSILAMAVLVWSVLPGLVPRHETP